MALVQALPISGEPHNPGHSGGARRRHPSGSSPPINAPPSTLEPMGSVSSLIANRPGPYQDHRSGVELGARVRRPTPGASCLGSESPQDSLLESIKEQTRTEQLKKQSSTTSSRGLEKESGNGNYTYLNEDYVGDWNDNHVMPASPGSDIDELKEGLGLNGNMGGPPPKLIPVSGKLERVSQRNSSRLSFILHITCCNCPVVYSFPRTWRKQCCGPLPSNPSFPRAVPPCSTSPLATVPTSQKAKTT